MSHSIWRGIDKDKFYKDLKALVDKKIIPGAEITHQHSQWNARGNHDGKNRLRFEEERSWVSDLAFLAAADEKAGSVSAFFVEEFVDERQLKFHSAANEGLSAAVLSMIRSILSGMTACARKEVSPAKCAEKILDLIIPVHSQRIHCRLESPQCVFPTHKRQRQPEPFVPKLTAKLENLRLATLDEDSVRKMAFLRDSARELDKLCGKIPAGDQTYPEDERGLLIQILKQAHAVSTSFGRKTLETSFEERRIGFIDGLKKPVRQIDKLSRYWGACKTLSCLARDSSESFDHFIYQPLAPFPYSWISGERRYVHAEMQVLIYVRLHALRSSPRVFGVSKAGCYLCDYFILKHGKYFTWGTHGTLFNKWKFPEVDEIKAMGYEINNTRTDELNLVMQSMRNGLNQLMSPVGRSGSRPMPMQSRIFDSGESLATFHNGSLDGLTAPEHLQIGSSSRERSINRNRRQDSGYESVPAEELSSMQHLDMGPAPQCGAATEQVHMEGEMIEPETIDQCPTDIEHAREIDAIFIEPQPLPKSNIPPLPNISLSSLASTRSATELRLEAITEASQIVSEANPAKFISRSVHLSVEMKDRNVPNCETTARVRHLPDRQSILIFVNENSPSAVIDRRNLLPGEECVIPVPETSSGRGIKLLLGKSSEVDEAMYLELENRPSIAHRS